LSKIHNQSMKSYIKAAAAILSQLGSLPLALPKIEAALKIGDVVCITGYDVTIVGCML